MNPSTRPVVHVFLSLVLLAPAADAELIWWNGERDAADAPPGKLLSDNPGYWGECVLTGVTYRYETEPTNPADSLRNNRQVFGRRLLDGRAEGDWNVPVGVNHGPLIVVFDFKRECVFSEIDISTRSKQVTMVVECGRREDGPWVEVFRRTGADWKSAAFARIPLAKHPGGRYVRLTVEAVGITWVDEVLVWGDTDRSDKTPEAYRPVVPTRRVEGAAFRSIPGIQKTTFSDAEFWNWKDALGPAARQPAVWSRAPTWDALTNKPLLPPPHRLIDRVNLVMARNETECAALVLTNTSEQSPFATRLRLSPFRTTDSKHVANADRLHGSLRVAGAIGSRNYGVNLGPLFAADNLLGASLMRRYVTNAAGIEHFPQVTLSRAGSVVLWLSVTTDGVPPGRYAARLSLAGGKPLAIELEVLDVTLPTPTVWLNTWSGVTSMFPFRYVDRWDREVAYKQSLGVTVWGGLPKPGTVSALARRLGRTIHHVYGLPRKYVDLGYASRLKPGELADRDGQTIIDYVHALVHEAKTLGLSYDQWEVELWDEPGEPNALLYGALAGLVRRADPHVRIYCNPCFWGGNGVLQDDRVFTVLSPWYRDKVDVSVPLFLLLRRRPKCYRLFDAPRPVRASYAVATQSAKSERAAQVELYRRQAWETFKRGWNGWGFYSYFAPRGDPWNDFDKLGEDRPDYLMVYPGPRGPVPTRQSECVREGWEDYRLLTLLKQQGRTKELAAILHAFGQGAPLQALRIRALRAASRPFSSR